MSIVTPQKFDVGDVHESMPEVCGATQRHADASVTGTQACQTHAHRGSHREAKSHRHGHTREGGSSMEPR